MTRWPTGSSVAWSMWLLVLLITTGVGAGEFRHKQAIPTPQTTPSGGQGEPVIHPVDRALVEAAVETVFAKYNTPEFRQVLSKDFFNATRLGDAIAEKVPRDAKLRVLAVQNIQMFEKRRVLSPSGDPAFFTSIVSVTVIAQMEFTNTVTGQFVRREGVNELILRIHEKIMRRSRNE